MKFKEHTIQFLSETDTTAFWKIDGKIYEATRDYAPFSGYNSNVFSVEDGKYIYPQFKDKIHGS